MQRLSRRPSCSKKILSSIAALAMLGCFNNIQADTIEADTNVSAEDTRDTESISLDDIDNLDSLMDSTDTASVGMQPTKIQKIVTTARGGVEQLIKDAPASITVISAEELQNKPHRDLAEALSYIPGIDIGTELGKTGGLKVSIRGMPSNYTLILIDGKRQNVAADINTDNAGWSQADTSFFPPISAIDRIEVIRGPMSTIYGSDAIGGVINIITKKKIDKFGLSVGLETTQNEDRQYGSGYTANLFTSIPIIKDTLGVQLRGRYYFREPSDVSFTYINTKGIPTVARPGFIGSPSMAHIYDLGGRILWNPNPSNSFYLDIQHGRQWYDNSKQQLGRFTSTAPEYIILRNNNLLSHKGNYGNVSVENTLQFNQSWNDGRMTNTKPNRPREIAGKDFILENRTFIELPYSNHLTVGGTYWFAWMQDMVARPTTFNQNTFSLFVDDEWDITDTIKLNVAIREDWNDRYGFHTSPKIYGIWEAIEDWLVIKGGVSTGYKAPLPNQLINGQYGFGAQGQLAFLGNPNLVPEQSVSAELTALSDNEYFELGATYFYTYFFDKIGRETLSSTNNTSVCGGNFTRGCSRLINVDRSYLQGVELYAGMKPIYGVTLDISYTFTDSMQLSGNLKGSPLTDTVNHLFSFRLGYSANSFGVYIRGEAVGSRFRGLRPNVDAKQIAALGKFYKPYFLMHLGGNYNINKHFRINAAIYNLFDMDFADYVQYGVSGNEPQIGNRYNYIQEGRRYYIGVNYDF